jgi:adenylate kinase
MRIVLFGAPGAGKGTQASQLVDKFGAAHISTGDALRQAVADKTEVGLLAKGYMDRGELVPDDVVIAIAKARLADTGEAGFVLDGFPRTINQAEALDIALAEVGKPLQFVVNLSVAEDLLIARLSGRWVCPDCKEPYHQVGKPPKVAGICDKCNGKLMQRDDDKLEAIQNRLRVYNAQTQPVLEYYSSRGVLRNVDAVGNIDEVFARVCEAIGG